MKGSIKKEIKTNNYSKSGSYSKPSTTTKAKASSKSNSSTKNSSSTSKSTVNSSQKRDTFTNSSAKVQKTSKTTQNAKTSCSKSSNSSKTTVKSTSTVNNSSKTAVLPKSSAQSKSNRDTFTYSSQTAKQTAATKSKTTSTAVKSNISNKSTVSGNLSKNKTKSAKNTVPDGLKQHLKHTTDQKQKAAMQNTIEQIKNNKLDNKFGNKIITKGKILTDDPQIKVGIYTGNKYTIVDGNIPSRSDVLTLNQDEKNYLVYLALHEAGGIGGFRSSLENPEAQMTAIVSSFMNAYEVSYYNKGDIDNVDESKTNLLRGFNDAMATHCTQYASDKYTKNTLTNNLRNGDYSGLDFSDYTNEQIICAEMAVNTVLSGIRNINSTAWYGTNIDRNTFQQNTWFAPKIEFKE